MKPDGYYEQFDASKHYEQLMFRAGKGLQSRELNDLQKQVGHQVKGIADVMMTDGDVVEGGNVVIKDFKGTDTETKVHCGASSVYLNGSIREVPEKNDIVIPVTGSVVIGVWLSGDVITETDDPSLRDPAVGAHNYDEAGAARLKVTGQWGLASDTVGNVNIDPFYHPRFYPVYEIEDGILIIKEPPPQLDSVTQALARYDRESNGGSYLVNGLGVSYRNSTPDNQYFNIEEGKAHIHGFEIAFNTSRQVAFDNNPDVKTVDSETQNFIPDSSGGMKVNTKYNPIAEIKRVNITVEKVKQLTKTRATDQGNIDPLDENDMERITKVSMGSKTYQQGVDYELKTTEIHWKVNEGIPSPGDSFDVTYHARKTVEVMVDEALDGFRIEKSMAGAGETLVQEGNISIVYSWHAPRVDLLVLTPEGKLSRIQGKPAIDLPYPPTVPEQHLALARIYQNWGVTTPEVENIAIRALDMQDLTMMQTQINELYHLLAIERLKSETNSHTPGLKYGLFVDPFFDDEFRDAGLTQTAAIIDNELVLPVAIDVGELQGTGENITLDYELEDVLVQTRQTGEMKVNPYQAFDPIPAKISLTPSVDHWTETQRNWTSPITSTILRGRGWRQREVSRSTRTEIVNRTTQQVSTLRQRDVHFRIRGFDKNEQLESVLFDGIELIEGVTRS